MSEINKLLDDFGILSSTSSFETISEAGLASIVQTAVSSSHGVMLVHDLFCLVNRKLQIERILSPKEFLLELSRIASIQVLDVCGYKVVISLRVADLNSKTTEFLRTRGPQTEEAIGRYLGLTSPHVLHLLLLKAEESLGTLLRDQHENVTWYVNTLI
jgi:hypothetical protein